MTEFMHDSISSPPFRTFIAGQSIDLDDARALAANLDLNPCDVGRIDGTPGLAISGRKKAPHGGLG